MKLYSIFENKVTSKPTGFVGNIENLSVKNENFRKVIYTSKHCQLVVMSLKPREEIGEETHADIDQFFRIEEGTGEVIINNKRTGLEAGSAIIIPAGSKHNIINTGDKPLKMYTVYSPPNHNDGTIHVIKADANNDTEHFDGETTE